MIFKKAIPLLIFITLFGCDESIKKNHKENKIQTISVLLSRGARSIIAGEIPHDSIIPKEFMDDLYLLDLDSNGVLRASHGFGMQSIIGSPDKYDLKMNYVEYSDSIVLSKKELQSIFSFARRIYPEKEYWSENPQLDSWLIKLKINNKTNVYYTGETIDVLNLDYLHLIDKLVDKSPVEIKEYR